MNAVIFNLTALYRCLLRNIKVNKYTKCQMRHNYNIHSQLLQNVPILTVNHLFAFLNVFMQYSCLYITMYAFHLLVCLHSWLCTLNIELLFIHTYICTFMHTTHTCVNTQLRWQTDISYLLFSYIIFDSSSFF